MFVGFVSCPTGLSTHGLLEPLSSSRKLGPLLWQLPPTFRRDDERLATALAALPRGRHAFEFRDPSWFTEDVYSLLREYKVALVVADRAGLAEAPWVDTAGWGISAFITDARDDVAITRRPSSDVGQNGSWPCRRISTATSTTTGRVSHSITRPCSVD